MTKDQSVARVCFGVSATRWLRFVWQDYFKKLYKLCGHPIHDINPLVPVLDADHVRSEAPL